ncbi:MAG: restriction endonuclease subunit S [Opitutaceae bacterium]
MSTGWATKRLGDVCAFDKAQGIHRHLPYVGLEHIESHTARFIGSTELQSAKSSTFRFSTEHVLYGRLRPYLNKVLAPDFEGHCSTEIFPIMPGAQLSREYLVYWFLADATVDRINATCTGARMPRADMNDVLEFDFPFAPLPEQQRIVGLLDEAFAGLATAKANAEKNLQNARALFESHLHSVFTQRGNGWTDTKLDEVCGFQNGFAFKSSSFKPSGCPILRISNIQDGKVDTDRLVFFEPTDYRENLDRYRIVADDLLIAMSGATTGKLGFNTESTVFHLNQRVGKFEPSKKLNKRFLYHFLSTKVEENLRISAGAAQPNLSTEQIKGFVLPLPPIEEQVRIVAVLESFATETQRLASLYQQKLAALEALKKSLLHQAFTGQL